MKFKYLYLVILILTLTCLVPASAGDLTSSTIALNDGITASKETTINVTAGEISIFDVKSGVEISSTTMINGIKFEPALSKVEDGKIVWGTGEKSWFIFDDPKTQFEYTYNGNQLKETVTIKEATELSFPIKLGDDSKIIPWYDGQYKIVSASSGDTMSGLIAQKPFGIDANNQYVPMDYVWDEKTSSLNLVYNKTILVLNPKLTEESGFDEKTGLFNKLVYDEIKISYPLIIDPTWSSTGGCWTNVSGSYTIIKWNATGSSTWTVPSGVTSVELLVVGGGGSGGGYHNRGGGGAGGLVHNNSYAVSGTITINVGSGGAGVNGAQNSGTFSSFDAVIGNGGGGGAGNTGGNGIAGGSGGGAWGESGKTGGSTNQNTTGLSAGNGTAGANGQASDRAGGGGGAGHAGYQNSTATYGGFGGEGLQFNITGEDSWYAAGGGASGGYGGANWWGYGGSGVGGSGGNYTWANPNKNATIDTGSGGGGGKGDGTAGGNGANGVVILKYLTPIVQMSSFTANSTTGIKSLTVMFNDTSTIQSITSWQWNFTNVTGNNTPTTFSTTNNVTYTFGIGNWSIKLNVTNSSTSNISTQVTFINVSDYIYDTWLVYGDHYIKYNGTDIIEKWNATGSKSWAAPSDVITVKMLVVGGGGSGGGYINRGGGGAGGLVYNATKSVTGTITVVVGSGGTGSAYSQSSGTNSSFDDVIGIGGGGGAGGTGGNGVAGGSGGGAWGEAGKTGGSSTQPTTGVSAGNGTAGANGQSNDRSGGGGGAGHAGYQNSTNTYGGFGGEGLMFNITGEDLWYAGGGGASGGSGGANWWGYGGSGVGGSGGNNSWANPDENGVNGTGSGGGGGSGAGSYGGGNGGSGVVIIRYSNETTTAPTSSFTTNITIGYTPLNVQFIDTSTGLPKGWIWNATNVTGNNTPFTFNTSQNAIGIFGIGNFSIILNASNIIGFNNSTQVTFINVSKAPPTANFTTNVTIASIYAMVVQFNDTSINEPTAWNWSFGDGRWFNTTTSSLVNTTYQYAVAGKYNVNLTVSNSAGSNTTVKLQQINLTSDSDSNLTSWLHMNGTNASTTFSDEMGIAWTRNGGAVISTLSPKYGGASGYFPSASNSYLSTPNSSAFQFGTGDFTIEMWVNVTSITGTNDHIISKTNNPRNQGWGLDSTGGTDSGWDFWMGNDSGGQVFFNAPIPNKTWTHIAVERISGTIYLYVDGNLTNSSAGFNANYDTSDPVWIGRQQNNYYNGFIDEFRISKGNARWRSNFTPPYNQYAGLVETIYPDINPSSTFRYKTDPGGNAYLDNQTQRNRTLQIQNITNTSYVVGSMIFNPLYGYVKSVQLNTSYYASGMTLVSSNIDNTNGLIEFNISKPTGFSPVTDRASILDYTIAYVNYTDGSDIQDTFFGYGYLINGSTEKTYGVHNFLGTSPVYGDWNFTADFTSNVTVAMVGEPIDFNSTFNGSYPNKWNWSFGDGQIDNGINTLVTHAYTTSGFKTVELTEYLWQNGSINSTKTRTDYIEIYDPVTASFITNSTGGINNVVVAFTDTSVNATYWNWSFKNVTGNNTQVWFSTIQNPIHTFGVGNFSIILNASNNWSTNVSTQATFVNISEMFPPIVNFTSNISEGAFPLVIEFTDNSTGVISWWNWSVRNATMDVVYTVNSTTEPDMNYTFNNSGKYYVYLYVGNSAGYSQEVENITVYDSTSVDFTASNTSGTRPLLVYFTDISTNATDWYWLFGDGNTSTNRNPTFIYDVPGNFSVNHSAYNTWDDTWENKTGYINVSQIPPPISSFNTNVTSGINATAVLFTDTSINATTWNWSFQNVAGNNTEVWFNITQNPIHTFGVGNFSIRLNTSNNLIAYNDSTQVTFINVSEMPAPTTDFSMNVSSGLFVLAVGFNDTSTGAPTEWNWSFGDGTFADGNNTQHLYTTGGNFTVILNATNAGGSGYKTKYVEIFNHTSVDFTASNVTGNHPLVVNFTDISTNATNWYWSFGDGNTSTDRYPTHIYDVVGNFSVNHSAYNTWDITWENKTGLINVTTIPPTANFNMNVSSGVFSLAVGFNDTSTGDAATSWNWSFGDGNYADGNNTQHLYTTGGNYTVILNASNIGGFSYATKYVEIFNTTVSGFTANVTSGLFSLPVNFNVSNANDNATWWNWSFGDGVYQNSTQNATHVYTSGGTYSVTEIAGSQYDTDTTTLTNYITVYNRTAAEFTANVTSGLFPLHVGFNVTTPYDNATSWNWSFGDGVYQNSTQNATHIYTSGGVYTVSETSTNAYYNNVSTRVNYITIYNVTIAEFTANTTSGIAPQGIIFNVTYGNDNATYWNWSFGDGTWSNTTTQNTTHTYTTEGVFTVNETASNPYNTSFMSRPLYITIVKEPTASFTVNATSGVEPAAIQFTNTSTSAPTSWNWSFQNVAGNNTEVWFSQLQDPIYIFPAGNYRIRLTATNIAGSNISAQVTFVNVSAPTLPPYGSFNGVPMSGNAPLLVIFTDTTANVPATWWWDFGDGTTNYTQNTAHTYAVNGNYVVWLNVSNVFGVSNTSKTINVFGINPVASFTKNNSLGGAPLTIAFTDTSTTYSSGILTWYWQFGDGGTSALQNPTYTYASTGNYNVNLTVIDSIGSSLSPSQAVYVTGNVSPLVDFVGVPVSGASAPLTVTFTDLSLGGETGWNWSFGEGNYSNAQNPVYVYNYNGQYTVTLIVANGTDTNTSTKVAYINIGVAGGTAIANFIGAPTSGNYPLTVAFTDLSLCNPACSSWAWDLDGDGAIDSNAKNPTFTYTAPMSYSPKLTVSNGAVSGTTIRQKYIVVGPAFVPNPIPSPATTWIPGYKNDTTNITMVYKLPSDPVDLQNSTYLKYWLQNFTATGEFSVYGFVTSLMAPLLHVFGFWIFLIIWALYLFAVWIRTQDVTMPLIIGILSMGTFGLLFPKESLPVIIIMFVVCGAIIITKLMKDSI